MISQGTDHYMTHYLGAGEEWADFGMEQPNPLWSHDLLAAGLCPLCSGSIDFHLHRAREQYRGALDELAKR